MDEQEAAQRQELLARTRAGLEENVRSNSEAFDRSLLTLSSAFLGGSLAFIDKAIPGYPIACGKGLLYVSWGLFTLTIVLTVASLMYGVLSFRWLTQAADRFYTDDDKDAWNVSDATQRVVMRYTWACGSSFIGAIFFLVLFIFINLPR